MKFSSFSARLSHWAGKPQVFLAAFLLVLLWALSGPTFGFNDSWQLVINTSTTVITFLMVFLIQHTQNRDNDMLHIKLDELLRATERAHNMLMNLDQLDSHSLRELRKVYCRLSELDSPEDGEEELESRIRAARNIDDAAS